MNKIFYLRTTCKLLWIAIVVSAALSLFNALQGNEVLRIFFFYLFLSFILILAVAIMIISPRIQNPLQVSICNLVLKKAMTKKPMGRKEIVYHPTLRSCDENEIISALNQLVEERWLCKRIENAEVYFSPSDECNKFFKRWIERSDKRKTGA